MTAYEQLSPREQKGYMTFIAEIKVDEMLNEAKDLVDALALISGWTVAAREVFAEGAVAWVQQQEYGGTLNLSNQYLPAGQVEYNCNRNYEGANAWFRVDDNTLLPRARQWHQGWAWADSRL